MNLFKRFARLSFKQQLCTQALLSILAIIIMMAVYYKLTNHTGKSFYSFYQVSIRGYLFSGFISVGSLLLSLHTFVIVNLKDKLFTTKYYRDLYAKMKNITDEKEIAKIPESDLLKPLDKLSSFINISVWLSILTAVSQFTIGLGDYGLMSVFCIWLALLTIFCLLNSLILIREHIKNMLQQSN